MYISQYRKDHGLLRRSLDIALLDIGALVRVQIFDFIAWLIV